MLRLIVFIYLLNFFKGQKCLCLELSRWPLEANACYFAYQSCCNLCFLVTKRWEKQANIILINLAQQYPQTWTHTLHSPLTWKNLISSVLVHVFQSCTDAVNSCSTVAVHYFGKGGGYYSYSTVVAWTVLAWVFQQSWILQQKLKLCFKKCVFIVSEHVHCNWLICWHL